MFADSTNTALCRCSLLFVFLSSSVQIPFDGCPEIHMHHPSHLRMKPQPLENNQTHCRGNYHTRTRKERRKKKKKEKNTQRRDSHTIFQQNQLHVLFLCQHAITYKQHRTCTMCL